MSKNEKYLFIYFLLLPFVDLATSLVVKFTNLSFTPGIIIKGITLIFCLVYIFFFSRSKYKKCSIIYMISILSFGFIYLICKNYDFSFSVYFVEAKNAFKYFYFPVTICGILNLFDDFKISKDVIVKIIISNAIIYTLLLFIPYITSTGFNSYDLYWKNEGVIGWFYSANEIGAILTMLSISIYFIMDYCDKKLILIVLPLMISLAAIGTKVSFLGLIIITIMCITTSILSRKKKALTKSFIVFVFLCISMLFSPILSNFSSLNSNNSSEVPKININNSNKVEKEINADLKTLEDLIPVSFITNNLRKILSSRDIFLVDNLNVYLNSNLEDKLFGLGWEDRVEINYTLSKKVIEIDVADIFIHYGIIGFIIYFLPLLYCFVMGIKNIKYFTNETWLSLLTFVTGLGVSLFAGHILSAPTVSIYLVLLLGLSMVTIRDKKEAR